MLTFVKLGGSLITDKSEPETIRDDVLQRVVDEIKIAYDQLPRDQLVIGHGSGSFGHHVASKYHTNINVKSKREWIGFAEVAHTAANLNQLVMEALKQAGLPVFKVQPSASALCKDGIIFQMALKPVETALNKGLIPVVYGDVAFDTVRGGTIISTEDIFTYMANEMTPDRILLAGNYEGVVDETGALLENITLDNYDEIAAALTQSEEPDVTGGMASKVESMLDLCESLPGLRVHIFSGMKPGLIREALLKDQLIPGTCIKR